jgi:hypothetical protein
MNGMARKKGQYPSSVLAAGAMLFSLSVTI